MARVRGVVWEEKMASLPMTINSIRCHLLGLGVVAQEMRSDSCVSASVRPSSSWMPMMSLRPCVRAAWPMWWRAEQSME